jgi:hopene-associated glycosyltransferase HpnB
MTALLALVLLAWLWLLFFRGGFWRDGECLGPLRPRATPSVAVVVPARDEAECVAASLASLLAQDYAGPFSVLLVDDGSSDGTAEIARALPGAERLRVRNAGPRPPGWAGKPWAVAEGIAATDAEWLLLTDADIVHAPQHLAALLAKAELEGADLVSEMVALNCESFAERALVPAFTYLFALLYPFSWVNDASRPTAAAAGGTMLVRRAALERIGGIAAIRGALIDDVALAKALKANKASLWLGHSRLARSIRRYPHFADVWRMIARSAYVQLGCSPLWLALSVAGLSGLFLAPPLAALCGSGLVRACGFVSWALMAVSFLPSLRRCRQTPAWAPWLPLIVLFYLAATLGSAFDHHRGRGVVWKRRSYQDRK